MPFLRYKILYHYVPTTWSCVFGFGFCDGLCKSREATLALLLLGIELETGGELEQCKLRHREL